MNRDRVVVWLSWLILLLTIGLLIYKINMNSDSLWLEGFARDLFFYGGAWRDWRTPWAPAYIPDVVLYFLSYPIFPTAPLRIFFVSACQALMLSAAAVWVAFQIRRRLSSQIQALIVLLVAFVVLASANSGMPLLANGPTSHYTELLFYPLLLGVTLKYLETPKISTGVLIVFLGGLAKVSSLSFVLNFTAPAICALLLALLFSKKGSVFASNRKTLAMTLILLIFSYFLGSFLDWLITPHYFSLATGRLRITPEGAGNSLKFFLEGTANAFKPDNLFILAFSLITALALAFLIYRFFLKIRIDESQMKKGIQLNIQLISPESSDWKLPICAFLLIVTLPVNLLGCILSGGLADPMVYRFLACPIILIWLIAMVIWEDQGTFLKIPLKVVTWIVLIVMLAMVMISFPKLKRAAEGKSLREIAKFGTFPGPVETRTVGDCLVKLQKQGVPIHSGVADYWMSRAVWTYLPDKNIIIPIHSNLIPFHYGGTLGPMLRPERYQPLHYNFIILWNDRKVMHQATEYFDVTVQTMKPILPKGYTVYFCGHNQIWVYKNDALDKAVKEAQLFFLFSNGFKKNKTN